MCNSIGDDYRYHNLETLTFFNDTTKLCIYKPENQLFMVKKVDPAAKKCYEALAEIRHPAISAIRYIDDQGDSLLIMWDYVAGESLAQLLNGGRTIATDTAVRITADICDGLSVLHAKGLVHRDINPNNIIVSANGHATVIDYGIVRSFQTDKRTDTVILGTPGYAAPEQFGFTQSDARTDIYAVGVLLNVMLTGKLPQEQTASGTLGKIVCKCIEIDSAKRYKSMGELQAAVQAKMLSGAPVDHFVRLMPGLRSPHLPVVILAALGYLTVFLFTIGIFATCKGGIAGIICTLLAWLLIFAVPFFSFHNVLGIWDRLPFSAGSSKHN